MRLGVPFLVGAISFLGLFPRFALAQTDPGPRAGPANAGGPLANLPADRLALFTAARNTFLEVDSVAGGVSGEVGTGLGPSFNANSCVACHAQPDAGGSSPHPTLGQVKTINPQIAFSTLDRKPGQGQPVPSFILPDGPVREARFILNPDGSNDGGVHGLYTIAGRIDAPAGCAQAQPDFTRQLGNGNVVFRIPTPTFGLGLVESIPDAVLQANLASTASARANRGIAGRFNTSGNDGTITRFGWKAQNKSLLIFAGEAYNVEQGVTNDLFPNERGTAACAGNPSPEDTLSARASGVDTPSVLSSDTLDFALFMRLLAPPAAATHTSSELHGEHVFNSIGCTLCHTATLTTGPSAVPGQSNLEIHPYSDFAIHHMGPGLADYVGQGAAGADEFRSAPLWGLGQRIFFLHDGRAGPKNGGLMAAIKAHESVDTSPQCSFHVRKLRSDGVACVSEAAGVARQFLFLKAADQQDVLNFLRSL